MVESTKKAMTNQCMNLRLDIKFLDAAEEYIKQIENRTVYLRISGTTIPLITILSMICKCESVTITPFSIEIKSIHNRRSWQHGINLLPRRQIYTNKS